MKRKLRVLMVLHNLSVVNGVSSYVMNYFRKLDHDLLHVDFVICSERDIPYLEEIEKAGGYAFVIPSIRNPGQNNRFTFTPFGIEFRNICLDGMEQK
mgnify:CR=1 FL=1